MQLKFAILNENVSIKVSLDDEKNKYIILHSFTFGLKTTVPTSTI